MVEENKGEGNGTSTKEVTYSLDKDGALVAKGADGEVRYVKESDLLAVKGSRETAEQRVKELEEAASTGGAETKTELESTRQKLLQAEAKAESLETKIAAATAGSVEAERLKTELETAKRSGENLSNQVLELQRTLIMATYGVPKATVEAKTKEQLEAYADALSAVTGKQLGNYAAGGGSSGGDFEGKRGLELARQAYESSNAK